MQRTKAWAIGAGIAATAAVVLTAVLWPTDELALVTGTVLADDPDFHKQRPVAQAQITVQTSGSTGTAVSDDSGLFRLRLDPPIYPDQPITLSVRHPDYLPFEGSERPARQLQILRMTPVQRGAKLAPGKPEVAIANVRVRYAFRTATSLDVASAARTFEFANTPNSPCDKAPTCSPDGRWKATRKAFTLDAGTNREFRNARVSCLAGPCAFTRVESDQFSAGGQVIRGSVLNWGDTVTYLVEAEVSQATVSDLVRHSYPVIFDRSMNFTLPPAAQGPSIEAEVDGEQVVFPLGPQLRLSWATCRLDTRVGRRREAAERARLYRCQLKPGYSFKAERPESAAPAARS
jgi:hypothetical protein